MKTFLYNEFVHQPVLVSELFVKKDRYQCIGTISRCKNTYNFSEFLKGSYTSRYVTYVTVYDNVMSIRLFHKQKRICSGLLIIKTKNGQPVKLDCLKFKVQRLKDLCVTNLNHLRRGRWGLTNQQSNDTKDNKNTEI